MNEVHLPRFKDTPLALIHQKKVEALVTAPTFVPWQFPSPILI